MAKRLRHPTYRGDELWLRPAIHGLRSHTRFGEPVPRRASVGKAARIAKGGLLGVKPPGGRRSKTTKVGRIGRMF
jgi:hypothetical protein